MVDSAVPVEDGEFVPVKWLCERASIHPVTYYDHVRQGIAPRPKKGVLRAEALAWLAARAEAANAHAAAASAAVAAVRDSKLEPAGAEEAPK